MFNEHIEGMVDFTCSQVPWPQLGGLTLHKATRFPLVACYAGIAGITKQNTKQTPVDLDAYKFLIHAIG